MLACSSSLMAATRNISSHSWDSLTSDKALSYKNIVEQQVKTEESKPGIFSKILNAIGAFLSNGSFQVLIWVLVSLLAVYGIYKLFLSEGQFLFDRKKRTQAAPGADEPVDISEVNWEALLQKAVQNNDLQQAVRFSYMWLLQLLQQSELIKYRDDKTNNDYYRELYNTAYKQSFRQLSRQYEYVVYGNYVPGQAAYNQYIDLFNQVKRQLGR